MLKVVIQALSVVALLLMQTDVCNGEADGGTQYDCLQRSGVFGKIACYFVNLVKNTVVTIPEPLRRLFENTISACKAAVRFIRYIDYASLDRRQQTLQYEFHKLRAAEALLDDTIEKGFPIVYKTAEDIGSFEKYVNGLIYMSQQLVDDYNNLEGKVRRLIKDTEDEFSKGIFSGLAESILQLFGRDKEEPEISRLIKPLLDILKLTSKKICILKGWESFLREAMNHARMNMDMGIELKDIISHCNDI